MNEHEVVNSGPAPAPSALSYEPPRVEQVVTGEDLALEIQYAGAGTLVG